MILIGNSILVPNEFSESFRIYQTEDLILTSAIQHVDKKLQNNTFLNTLNISLNNEIIWKVKMICSIVM